MPSRSSGRALTRVRDGQEQDQRTAEGFNRHTISRVRDFGRRDSNLFFRLRVRSKSQELIRPREAAEMEPTTAKVTAAFEVIRVAWADTRPRNLYPRTEPRDRNRNYS